MHATAQMTAAAKSCAAGLLHHSTSLDRVCCSCCSVSFNASTSACAACALALQSRLTCSKQQQQQQWQPMTAGAVQVQTGAPVWIKRPFRCQRATGLKQSDAANICHITTTWCWPGWCSVQACCHPCSHVALLHSLCSSPTCDKQGC